ncbi:MAG: hypothetical protein HQL37_10380 [Alphaproteobacteria bacterium]|nr:hypothetical protein [Alphaproteobacteria bacterium]
MHIRTLYATLTISDSRNEAATMSSLSELRAFLKKQPPQSQGSMSNRQLISKLKPEIKQLLDDNYNFQEIANLLEQKGISIKPNTLRNYYYARDIVQDADQDADPPTDKTRTKKSPPAAATGHPKKEAAPTLPTTDDVGDFAAFPRA